MSGNVKKNSTASAGKFSYNYADLAAINEYLESNKLAYEQYTEAFDINGTLIDYIMTQRYRVGEKGELTEWGKPMRGLRLQYGNETPQQLGSRVTYLRRYSLLMAFGLAAEDNDAVEVKPPVQPTTNKPKVEPQTTSAETQEPKKIDFTLLSQVRAKLPTIETEDELNKYWLSLKLLQREASLLKGDFAKRKKEIVGDEPEAEQPAE